jgi:hypothetical protein
MSVPPGFVRRLMGCNPYQAHDSTPLQSVSSTTMVMSTSLGSYLAIPSSSVRSSVATMAKFFAGMPLRSGLSPYRPKEMPGFPSVVGGEDDGPADLRREASSGRFPR